MGAKVHFFSELHNFFSRFSRHIYKKTSILLVGKNGLFYAISA